MYPVCITAIVCAGGIYSSTGANLSPNEAAYQFKVVRPKVILTSESHKEAAKKACEISGVPSKICIVNSKLGHHDIYDAETGVSLICDTRLQWQNITDQSVLSSTTVFILFTSGTSGYPKSFPACYSDCRGVELTHYSVVLNIEQAFIQSFSPNAHKDYQKIPEIMKDEHKLIALCHTPYSHVSVLLTRFN